MQFRQNGQRDDRRRRVLREESLTSPATSDTTSQKAAQESPPSKVACRGYSAAVSVESQPPISCLIASRPWTLSVLVLAALSVIAGLEAAYAHVFHGSGLGAEVTGALDVTARGSLAAWFSSVLLSMAAVNAALVYWLRSHKLDDYRGRYRVWLWTALGLMVAAVAAATGLQAVLGHLIASQFDTPWLQNPSVNGVAVMSLVFGGLAVRLAFEIWPSRLARTWSLVVAVGYVVAILIRLDVLMIDSAVLTAMAESTALLTANLAVAVTVASFCRYVHLESQGALKPRRVRRAKPDQAKAAATAQADTGGPVADGERPATTGKAAAKRASGESATAAPEPTQPAAPAKKTLKTASINDKSIRCDSPHQSRGESRPAGTSAGNTNSAAQATAAAARGDEQPENEDPLDYHPETGEKLSKSERRRLRKQMRRQKKVGSG